MTKDENSPPCNTQHATTDMTNMNGGTVAALQAFPKDDLPREVIEGEDAHVLLVLPKVRIILPRSCLRGRWHFGRSADFEKGRNRQLKCAVTGTHGQVVETSWLVHYQVRSNHRATSLEFQSVTQKMGNI